MMRINISEDAMGFYVRLAGQGEGFQTLLANLKAAVPANCRGYRGGHWFIHRRAARDLSYFLSSMQTHYNAEVIRGGAVVDGERAEDSHPGPVVAPAIHLVGPDAEGKPVSDSARASLLKLAFMNGYLSVSQSQGVVELEWEAQQSAKGQPAITLQKLDRWYQVSAHVYGQRLTDEARNAIFQSLIDVSLPGGKVRVSNSILWASRIPFVAGAHVARWLASVMFADSNREPGRGRDYARCEAEKRADGSIKVIQSGITRRRSNAA